MEAYSLQGFRRGHRRQDGGQSPRMDHVCFTPLFPFIRAGNTLAGATPDTHAGAEHILSPLDAPDPAAPPVRLVTEGIDDIADIGYQAMRGKTQFIQMSCSCAVAAAQPSRTTTQS